MKGDETAEGDGASKGEGGMRPDGPQEGCIPVVAAVLTRGDDFLLALRPGHKRHGGLWEFPGGKVDPGEDEAQALARELREELGVELTHAGASLATFRDPGSPFEIHFRAVEVKGEPRALEHDAVAWISRRDVPGLPLAPSDRRFVLEVLLT